MKLELKTDNDDFPKPFYTFFFTLVVFTGIIIVSNISLKLGVIAKHYEINYLCKVLIIDKSPSNFKKLSKLSNQTSKQKVWDFCREIIK